MRTLRGLALAGHPGPSLAVTAFAGALALSAGLGGRSALVIAAFLTGQLSIGWLNDYVDRDLDAAAGRADKPLSTGGIDPTTVRTATAVAAGACVVTSLALGLLPGVLHLAAVASAYSYDLALKRTPLSWAPFALSFGLLPCIVTTALPRQPFPPPTIWLAGAALGVAAHLANTVKDVEADALTGVRGFPQVIGPRRSLILATVLVALAGVALVVATPDSWATWVFAVAAVLAAGLAAIGSRRTAFVSIVVAAGLVVVGVVISGGAVSG